MVGSTARTARQTSMPEPSGSRRVEDGDVGAQRRDPVRRIDRGAGLAHDLDVAGALQQGAQPLAHDLVVVEQVHADRPGVVVHGSFVHPAHLSPRRITRSMRSSPVVSWLIQTTLRPGAASSTSRTRAAAVAPSRWAVGSSSTSTGWSASRDRATATRARSPPDSPACPSPSQVCRPSGRASSHAPQPGPAQGGVDLRVARPGPRQPDVLHQRAGEDVGVVVHQPDLAADVVQPEVGQRHAAEPRPPGRRVEEAQQHGGQGALAGTRTGPPPPTRSPGPRRSVEVAQHEPSPQPAATPRSATVGSRRSAGRVPPGRGPPGPSPPAPRAGPPRPGCERTGRRRRRPGRHLREREGQQHEQGQHRARAGRRGAVAGAATSAGAARPRPPSSPAPAPGPWPATRGRRPSRRARGPPGRPASTGPAPGACHMHQLARRPARSRRPAPRAGPGRPPRRSSARRRRPRATSVGRAPGDAQVSSSTRPATGEQHGRAGDRERPRHQAGTGAGAAPAAARSTHGVDVVDDRREHVAAAPAQPAGRQRHDRVVHLRPGARRAAAARRRGSAAARRSAAPAGPARRRGPRRSRPAASAPAGAARPARSATRRSRSAPPRRPRPARRAPCRQRRPRRPAPRPAPARDGRPAAGRAAVGADAGADAARASARAPRASGSAAGSATTRSASASRRGPVRDDDDRARCAPAPRRCRR